MCSSCEDSRRNRLKATVRGSMHNEIQTKFPKDEINDSKAIFSASTNLGSLSYFITNTTKRSGHKKGFKARFMAKQTLMACWRVWDKLIVCFLSTHPSQSNQCINRLLTFQKSNIQCRRDYLIYSKGKKRREGKQGTSLCFHLSQCNSIALPAFPPVQFRSAFTSCPGDGLHFPQLLFLFAPQAACCCVSLLF